MTCIGEIYNTVRVSGNNKMQPAIAIQKNEKKGKKRNRQKSWKRSKHYLWLCARCMQMMIVHFGRCGTCVCASVRIRPEIERKMNESALVSHVLFTISPLELGRDFSIRFKNLSTKQIACPTRRAKWKMNKCFFFVVLFCLVNEQFLSDSLTHSDRPTDFQNVIAKLN